MASTGILVGGLGWSCLEERRVVRVDGWEIVKGERRKGLEVGDNKVISYLEKGFDDEMSGGDCGGAAAMMV